jgi:hypothetical protein
MHLVIESIGAEECRCKWSRVGELRNVLQLAAEKAAGKGAGILFEVVAGAKQAHIGVDAPPAGVRYRVACVIVGTQRIAA